MRQKIKYVIKVVGEEKEYLAYTRGQVKTDAKYEGYYRADWVYGEHKFKCTSETMTYNQEHQPLVWREFNCPYILTVLDEVRTIEVMEK